MAKTSKSDEVRPIIIKKIKKVEGGHHGGAWKVAYADFVTAMMAFFLLLWLLNVSTEEALNAISDYFDPSHPQISQSTSGAGGLMGGTSMAVDGAMTTEMQTMTSPTTGKAGEGQEGEFKNEQAESSEMAELEEQLRQQENTRFEQAKKELEEKLKENPQLADLAKNLLIDITPEGMRIQLIDQQGKPLFPIGSADMYDYTKLLLKTVADVIRAMPNDISVRGHTDSHKYAAGARYTNWELSSDRANASRRVLLENKINTDKLANVMGLADKDLLYKDKPLDPRNRRISLIMLRETVQQAYDRGAVGSTGKLIPEKPAKSFQKTPGAVYFP